MEKEKEMIEEQNINVPNDVNNTIEEKIDNTEEVASEDLQTEDTEEKVAKKKGFFGKRESKEAKLKEQISQLEAEKLELNDKFLRLYSEFDNYKKRSNKERLDLISTASEKVILQLLPIIDDFERAIAANQKTEDVTVIKAGFELIYNKTLGLLKRFDVEEIEAVGKEFDTDFHEAITNFPAQNEEDKGKVIDVTEKGYKIKDKVIRYSKVVVAN